MTFYLKPPRGTIALHKLRACVEERLRVLSHLEECGRCDELQLNVASVRDGSALDRTAHYMLRLLSLESAVFRTFVIRNEKLLFALRLDECTEKQFVSCMKVVERHAEERLLLLDEGRKDEAVVFLRTLAAVCRHLYSKRMSAHVFQDNHQESCSDLLLEVPFTVCLPFVRRREVELRGGSALVPCGKWKKLLLQLFEKHYALGVQEMSTKGVFAGVADDPRMISLLQEAEHKLGTGGRALGRAGEMQACDVDARSALFPPCMRHLHGRLRAVHRLPHEARRLYTLFLRAAGMGLDEALAFWSLEYSQPHSNCSRCTHSWQKDAHKYRYSIRHMYGLEGGRYSYAVPCCRAIQRAKLTALSEEGCPFQHFEEEKLLKCLHDNVRRNASVTDTIVRLAKQHKPADACAEYRSACLSAFSSDSLHKGALHKDNTHIQNPRDFYAFLKKHILQ